MIWFVVLLAVFLFYKFVPWKHKKVFYKASAVLALIIGVTAGCIGLYDEWDHARKSEWKKASFIHIKDTAEGRKRLVIKVCNNRDDADLLEYEIKVAGFKKGRSTPLKVFLRNNYESLEGYSEFKTDIIVKAKSCETISWVNDFNSYDRYETKTYDFMDKWSK